MSAMSSARLSPTANLLRKSRFFSLPPPLSPPPNPPTSKPVFESDTATRPYPLRASVVTPGSSLAKGDWGLKRPLPARSTWKKSSRPVVRVIEQDTFEHVTDFESASDHVMTLEKFQDMNLPVSLLSKVDYSASRLPEHTSPFEENLDNTEISEDRHKHNAKQFRQSGPSLTELTEGQFADYLKKIQNGKPEIMRKLRSQLEANRLAQRRKEAQDNGQDMDHIRSEMSDEEFRATIKELRENPYALGPVIYDLLDIPSPASAPSARLRYKYFESSPTKLATIEYAKSGPPKTHPSGGLSYQRSHTQLYNHPHYGPQAFQRPVEARILRPKGKFKGRTGRAVAGVGGIAVEDVNSLSFVEQGAPPGLGSFDASVPGGGKYWVSPIRAYIDSAGKLSLASFQATAAAKAAYGVEDYKKPTPATISAAARADSRWVPLLDRNRSNAGDSSAGQSNQNTEGAARNLMRTLGGS